MIGSWDKFSADFSHVNEVNGRTYVSLIDHIFWNSTVTENVIDCGILHLIKNYSDHCPIYCKIAVNTRDELSDIAIKPKISKPSWKNASNDEKEFFSNILSCDLDNINMLGDLCSDVHCRILNIYKLLMSIWTTL